MFPYNGKTALITGASSGIGAQFARELAARGMNLILVARNQAAMDKIADELRARHGVQVDVFPQDLSEPTAAANVFAHAEQLGWNVDLLVNNAGFVTYGPFESIDPAQEQAEIQVNIAALVGLTHAFLPGMLARRSGGIINNASLAGFQPIPYLTVYAATKAFVISFSVALRQECRGRNVRVLGLCPGTTKTEIFDRANANAAAVGIPRTVEQVVATALRAFDRNRSLVVDGVGNRIVSYFTKIVPRWLAASIAGWLVSSKG
ncbi:SDR family oxidoreductase [Blastopirellula sp. JC732]|uniref:SDR family oxidoreductase n=1 Tax=Blastopirellula sediminis TaxID=2894196 RepID=A0A9X1MNJ7_9BACT|nr:SDR family oxidoreductase [Blastopirellula sediminis]MCC9608479.1 SDR family oxidoreductase [Blastopirellula sediminis]MCC9628744.1 SDR family oxidoreductase [Blastopirellula sediminis]